MNKTKSKSEAIKKAAYDVLYLTGCGINGIVPEKNRVDTMNFPAVYALSRMQSLSAITCAALEPLFPDKEKWDETFKKWQDDKNKAVRKELLMNAERGKLLSFMEENGIWYAPLKGVILKEMYPKIGLRQMADNDILYDKSYRRAMRDWFKANGYTVEKYGQEREDGYQKKPVYNFELTMYLFDDSLGDTLKNYYENIKENLLPMEGTKYGFRFTDEDFYVYFMAHAYKHFTKSGIGLRVFSDCYVFLKAKGDTLNWEYIRGELEKTELTGFEKEVRETALKVFSDPEKFSPDDLTAENRQKLDTILVSGTYGTYESSMEYKLTKLKKTDDESRRKTKFKYLIQRIFPPMTYYKAAYPFLYRHKFFIPFFYVYRLICKPFTRLKSIKRELHYLFKSEK